MKSFTDASIPPVEETIADKTEVLDWSLLEERKCDLEFRTDFRFGPGAGLEVVLQLASQLLVTSLAVWFLARPVAIWVAPRLDHTVAALLSTATGVTWAVVVVAGRWKTSDGYLAPLRDPATFGRALLPSLLWQAVTFSTRLDVLAGAFFYYLTVSLPLAVFFFDRFATHVIHWITASAKSDHSEQTLGRHMWASRLVGSDQKTAVAWAELLNRSDPACRTAMGAVRRYRWGMAWLAVATLAPSTFVALFGAHARPATLGLQLVAGILFGLTVAVLTRSRAQWRVVPLFFRMLAHWFYFGWRDRLPPWLFESPCGSWGPRRFFALLAVGLLSLPLTALAAHAFAGILESPGTAAAPIPLVQSLPDGTAAVQALPPVKDGSPIRSWHLLAPTVLVCMSIPPVCFCLIGILLTGNVVLTYHNAFEASHRTPAPPTFPSQDDTDSMAIDE
jgi:hypothetical protein